MRHRLRNRGRAEVVINETFAIRANRDRTIQVHNVATENPAFAIVLVFRHRNTVAVNSCEVHMCAGSADLLGHLQALTFTVGRGKSQSAAEIENKFIDHINVTAEAAGSNNDAFRCSDIKRFAFGFSFNA